MGCFCVVLSIRVLLTVWGEHTIVIIIPWILWGFCGTSLTNKQLDVTSSVLSTGSFTRSQEMFSYNSLPHCLETSLISSSIYFRNLQLHYGSILPLKCPTVNCLSLNFIPQPFISPLPLTWYFYFHLPTPSSNIKSLQYPPPRKMYVFTLVPSLVPNIS